MHDYPHLRLHRARTEHASHPHAEIRTGRSRPTGVLARALQRLAAPARRRHGGRGRAAVHYAGAGVAGDFVE